MDHDRALIERSAELQQQWHGWGSPVGLGIGLVGFGLFLALACWGGSLFIG